MCGTRRVGSRPATSALMVRWNPAGRDICAPALYLLYGLTSSSLSSTQRINSPARDRGMQVSLQQDPPNGRHAVTAPAYRLCTNRAERTEPLGLAISHIGK